MLHTLKILPEYFDAVISGYKTFEVRLDDRNFQVHDGLLLREWSMFTGSYTGRSCVVDVTYILRGEYCIDGYCIMSIRLKGVFSNV